MGQVVDVALTEACLAVLESTIADYDVAGVIRQPSGTRLDGIAPSNLYRTRDAVWLVIAANQDSVFGRLSTALGVPGWATDPRFVDHLARGRHQDLLDEMIAERVATRDAEDIVEMLSAAGVPAGRVNTVAELVEDPQLRARDMLVAHDDERLGREVLGPGVIPRLTGTPGSVRSAGSARPGQHNREIYTELLGLTDADLGALVREGIV